MKTLTLGILLFDDFEPLDVFGPAEMFGISEMFETHYIALEARLIKSRFGAAVLTEKTVAQTESLDVLFVPGGLGTRREVNNTELIKHLSRLASSATYVLSVCTGAALLAKTRHFDGKKMTTNKRAFEWVAGQRPQVAWQRNARWVEEGNLFSSSGISAGTDMTLGFIAHLFGDAKADAVAQHAEYIWNRNKDHDPFCNRH